MDPWERYPDNEDTPEDLVSGEALPVQEESTTPDETETVPV